MVQFLYGLGTHSNKKCHRWGPKFGSMRNFSMVLYYLEAFLNIKKSMGWWHFMSLTSLSGILVFYMVYFLYGLGTYIIWHRKPHNYMDSDLRNLTFRWKKARKLLPILCRTRILTLYMRRGQILHTAFFKGQNIALKMATPPPLHRSLYARNAMQSKRVPKRGAT